MRSVERELENVERLLRSPAEAGRAFYGSVQSALSSIRNSMTQQQSTTASSNAAGLWDRLRHAERAHSTRTPLNVLRRASSGNSVPQHTPQKRPTSRSSSETLASRRKLLDESEGDDLSVSASVDRIEIVLREDHDMEDLSPRPDLILPRKSQSSLGLVQQTVLFPEIDDDMSTDSNRSSNRVYSWGDGINSLHDDTEDRGMQASKLSNRLKKTDIGSVDVGRHHSAITTVDGDVFLSGDNLSGQVDPSRGAGVISKPILLELNRARITQVSCGLNHTAALRSNGNVLTWGSNEYGQLGHRVSTDRKFFCKPSIFDIKNHWATQIACGANFTMILTHRMQVLGAGRMPDVSALQHLPITKIFAGDGHVVVLTSHGNAYALGDNAHAQCGQPFPDKLNLPVLLKIPSDDDDKIVEAACGMSHSILISEAGKVFVCGDNTHGQLGMRCTSMLQELEMPVAMTKAAAGDKHSLLLDVLGNVWLLRDFGYKKILSGQNIQKIAAGGSHSVAVAKQTSLFARAYSDSAHHHHEAPCLEGLLNADADLVRVANSTEELLRTPAVLNSLFLDPADLDDLYVKLMAVDKPSFRADIATAIEKGMYSGITTVRSNTKTRLVFSEQVHFLLLYLQCPLFINWRESSFDRRGDLILAICDTILNLPYEGYRAFVDWAIRKYSKELFEKLLLAPLLAQFEKAVSIDVGAERRCIPHVAGVLKWLFHASERAGGFVKREAFHSKALDRVHPQTLYEDMQRYKQKSGDFYFRAHPFLYSPTLKRNLLHVENEINMVKTASRGVNFSEGGMFTINPFFTLPVDRGHLLQSTLNFISRADSRDLRKKLRVVFNGEAGVDAGGVTREFFHLLTAELFDANTGMWTNDIGDEVTWFNSDCCWNDEGYFLSGVLVGLAVYNQVLLDVNFPQAVYRKLLGLPLGLEDMVDPQVQVGLQSLLDYEGNDVEDIFCLTFEVTWMTFGEEKKRELKPGGADIPVTAENKEEYVKLYVSWLLVESVYAQFQAFQAGFMRVMEDSSLDILDPEELELLVVGTQELDFEALERNTVYEGGFTADSPAVKNFWEFIKGATRVQQVSFLKFTTGAARAPIGGLGAMRFKIQRAGPDSEHLPTSHTCFNTLLLPDYGNNAHKLKALVGRAILECEGFGLQ